MLYLRETRMVAAEHRQDEQDDVLAGALLSLLQFGLSRREQIVIRAILLAPRPPTASEVATRTGLAYSHVKATVRTLIAWRMLTRNAEGICFQPEPSRWGPPTVPAPANDVETDRSARREQTH